VRIASVAIHLGQEIISGGVGQKLRTQCRLWSALGHEARLFLHTPDAVDDPEITSFRYDLRAGGPPGVRTLRREASRSRALAELIAAAAAYQPDVIYLRYGLFTWPLPRLLRTAPTVVEINTNDVDEYRYRGSFYYYLNRESRRWTLGPAAGLVYLSREIGQLAANRRWRKPGLVLANGIDFSAFEPLPAPNHAQPHLVMVATPGYDWHGVDHLLRLAQLRPELHVDVVGYGPQDVPGELPANVRLHGFLRGEALLQVLAQADAACGTLGLYRKNMEEASPLKVREALGYGIPVVLGYEDTDLSGRDFPFILQIPNRPDGVETHAAEIADFANRMRGQRADREALRPLLDQRAKEAQRLAFLESIARKTPA